MILCTVTPGHDTVTSIFICVDSYLLIYIDNLNDKYIKKSDASETTQIQLADFTKKFSHKHCLLEKKLLFHNRPVDFDESLS